MNDSERWHNQEVDDIWDSFNDWEYHKFACISKGGNLLDFSGHMDEDSEGGVNKYIECITNVEYTTDDIAYWIEFPD